MVPWCRGGYCVTGHWLVPAWAAGRGLWCVGDRGAVGVLGVVPTSVVAAAGKESSYVALLPNVAVQCKVDSLAAAWIPSVVVAQLVLQLRAGHTGQECSAQGARVARDDDAIRAAATGVQLLCTLALP